MRYEFHGNETLFENPEFASKKIPDGIYSVRATVYPDDGEPFDIQTPAELRDGTLYVPSKAEFEKGAS